VLETSGSAIPGFRETIQLQWATPGIPLTSGSVLRLGAMELVATRLELPTLRATAALIQAIVTKSVKAVQAALTTEGTDPTKYLPAGAELSFPTVEARHAAGLVHQPNGSAGGACGVGASVGVGAGTGGGEMHVLYPLHAAVMMRAPDIVMLLLAAKAEVNVTGGVDRRTPLHLATAMVPCSFLDFALEDVIGSHTC
jgi:hypothetical protein